MIEKYLAIAGMMGATMKGVFDMLNYYNEIAWRNKTKCRCHRCGNDMNVIEQEMKFKCPSCGKEKRIRKRDIKFFTKRF